MQEVVFRLRRRGGATPTAMWRRAGRDRATAARTLAAQQRRFDWFRQRYNAERRHEALDQRLPASLYQASPRSYRRALADHVSGAL